MALEFARTGETALLFSSSIMSLIFGTVMYLAGHDVLKTLLYLCLAGHFFLWGRLLRRVFGLPFWLAAAAALICEVLCLRNLPIFISYMAPGYLFITASLYAALRRRQDPEAVPAAAAPVLALLALVFRQEAVLLFPLILAAEVRAAGPLLRRLAWPAAALVAAIPILAASWSDEGAMNREPFDKAFVTECAMLGPEGPAQGADMWKAKECRRRGLTANRSYMLNIATALIIQARLPRDAALADLAERIYEAPNPSFKNVYYHLKFRRAWPAVLAFSGAALFAVLLLAGGPRRGETALLALAAALFFLTIYSQKYSVGVFERFYCYLTPLFAAPWAITLWRAISLLRAGLGSRPGLTGG